MSTIVPVTAHLSPTKHGKLAIAASMYAKGEAFVGAAVLLRQKGGYEFVVLYLLCHGIENVLKGLLLFIDYNKYKQKLKHIGHDLLKASHKTAKAAGFNELKPEIRDELELLNKLYSKHLLRYGSSYDILVNPNSIPSQHVLRRMGALLRLVKRKGIFSGALLLS